MVLQKIRRHLPIFRARAPRTLLETMLVLTALLLSGPLFVKLLSPIQPVRDNIYYILCGLICIIYCALRLKLEHDTRSWLKRLFIEMGIAGILCLEFILIPALLNILVANITIYTFLHTTLVMPYTLAAGLTSSLLFFLCRIGIKLSLFWNRLRKTHLRWALTHAHLLVVVIGAGAVGLPILCTGSLGALRGEMNPLSLLVAFSGMLFGTGVVLAIALPPSALFSYLFARRTTKRIEALASATSALRAENYSIRITVEGEDEVARLQADFNAMAAALEQTLRELQQERDNVAQLLQARRELIASVSHELRTPVATVRSYLESSLAGWSNQPAETLRQDLQVMEQQTIRLQLLIDDLFTLARAEVGKLELRCVPTEVEQVVRRVVATMAPLAWRSSRVEMVADLANESTEPLQALVDGDRLEQIVQNLLHNGVRHTPPGGIVIVSIIAENDVIVMQVKDTGEGIITQELPHIWERFYRTQSSQMSPGSGTGLGLAIVKELTEAMGGSVTVESSPGVGTCFTVRLPEVIDTPLKTLQQTTPASIQQL